MDNLFLPRESEGTETGPQIFTKNDGAEPVDFIFASLSSLFDSSSSSSSSEESSSSSSEESSSSSSEESSSSSSEESSSSSSEDGPGLFNSVLVENAGLSVLNGIYVYVTEFEGKPYYYKPENPSLFILWFEGMWEIYDFDLDGLPIYIGNEDVLYPWNVTVWQSPNPIYEPVPTVTKVL
jgi:hypothetical protein